MDHESRPIETKASHLFAWYSTKRSYWMSFYKYLRHLIGLIGHLSVSCVTYTFVQDKNTGETQTKHPCPKWVRNREIICRGSETELATVNEELLIWYCRNSASSCNITYVVQQDTQLLLWLNIYSQYVWQLDMFRTYKSILRSIYKLCVAGLICEDCVWLGVSIR